MFFLELSCFFYDPVYVGNLISASSAFSKSILVHLLLKLHLENFEHYFASMWDECSNYHKIYKLSFLNMQFLS